MTLLDPLDATAERERARERQRERERLHYFLFCAFVAADGGPQGPHSLEADVVETGRRVLTAS